VGVRWLCILGLLPLAVGFQNCGGSLQALDPSESMASSTTPIPATPPPVPLIGLFINATTQVTNSAQNNLPKTLAQIQANPDSGGASLGFGAGTFENGQTYSANNLLIMPPKVTTDFTQVLFNASGASALLSTATWNLTAKYGIQQSNGPIGAGAQVEIIAYGDPIDPTDSNSAVLDSFTVTSVGTDPRSTALGTWPLRSHFQIAIRVSAGCCHAETLVADGLALNAVGPRPILGIAQSDLVWNPGASGLVTAIGGLGAPWLRTTIRSAGIAASLAALAVDANKAGMSLELTILQDPEDYDDLTSAYNNNTAAFTELCGWAGGSMIFSQLNVALYSQRLETNLKALKAASADVAAFEIGNELDWVCFNGDITMGQSPQASRMTAFIAKYALVLQESRRLIDLYYPQASLLTFGMANVGFSGAPSAVQDPQNLLVALKNVQGVNVLDQVDGFAEHIYPNPSSMAAALNPLASVTQALGSSKPFWITEWGFGNSTGVTRYSQLRQFLELANSTGSINIRHLFLYTYADGSGFSLMDNDGVLDPSSRVIQQYNSLISRE